MQENTGSPMRTTRAAAPMMAADRRSAVFMVSGGCLDQCSISEHIQTVLLPLLGAVVVPVGKASQQGSIVAAVVQIQHPLGRCGVAVVGIEHGTQGGDHTLAGGGAHGVSVVDLISVGYGLGAAVPPLCQCLRRLQTA